MTPLIQLIRKVRYEDANPVKILKHILTYMGIGCSLLCAVYLLFSMYYSVTFPTGTWINGIYCTGMTPAELSDRLNSSLKTDSLAIVFEDGSVTKLSPEQIKLHYSYTNGVERLFREKNFLLWIENIFFQKVQYIKPDAEYDNDLLRTCIDGWPVFDEETDSEGAEIRISSEGYILFNNSKPIPVKSEIFKTVKAAIEDHQLTINLQNYPECYKDIKQTKEYSSLSDTFSKIDILQNTGIVYKFSDTTLPIDGSVVSKWIITESNFQAASEEKKMKSRQGSGLFIAGDKEISFPQDYKIENGFVTDQDGNILVSEDAMYSFIESLCNKYDTVGTDRKFLTSQGDNITVSGGTYGNQIDKTSEFEYLRDSFLKHKGGEHIPQLLKSSGILQPDDIGRTYIEIDLTKQRLYYYQDGKLMLTMPVVTGSVKRHSKTPEGVYYIYNKAKNRTLKGPGYSSFVHYWMAVYKGIGIHDADWRDDFGGDIFVDGGSHGCINCPKEQVSRLYEMTQLNTPVIIYYR